MKRRPIADLRVIRRPDLAEDCVRIEVECRYSTTGLTHVPGGALDVTTPALITMACFEHADRCGECDVSEAHQRGDPQTRAQVEQLAVAMRVMQTRRYVEEVRN